MPAPGAAQAEASLRERNTRSLALVLSAGCGLLTILAVLRTSELEVAGLTFTWTLLGGAMAWLAKGRWTKVAAYAVSLLPALGVAASVLFLQRLGSSAMYLCLGVVFASLTLDRKGLIAVGIVTVATLAGLTLIATQWNEPKPPAFTLQVNAAVVLVMLLSLSWVQRRTQLQLLAQITSSIADAETAETRVIETEARYRLVAENTHDLILLSDLQGRCAYASPSVERLLGVAASELVDQRVGSLAVPDDREVADALLQTATERGTATGVMRCGKPGTQPSVFEVVATKVPAQPWVVFVARDVTAQRSLTSQLRQAQKLEALGRFAGGIAHDFNNVLSIIRTCSDLAGMLVDGEHEVQTELGEIKSAVDRGAQLTSQLLAFSRHDVNVDERVEVSEALGRLSQVLQRIIGRKVQVAFNVEPVLHRVALSRIQLEQVVMNLAVNARDAMPDGGTLSVTASNKRGQRGGESVVLEVRDDGVGMTEEVKARLFEPFFTTKPPGVGTGLGLATVYGIVQGAGGTLEVESSPGKGATFRITLPRVAERPKLALVSRPEAEPLAGRQVLVVDDDPELLSLMVRVVRSAGHTARQAASAADALTLIEKNPGCDALITDVVLAEMNGLELATHLRGRLPRLGVVLTSGFSPDPEGVGRLLEAGARFVPKPFTPDQLLRALADALAAAAQPPPASDSRPSLPRVEH